MRCKLSSTLIATDDLPCMQVLTVARPTRRAARPRGRRVGRGGRLDCVHHCGLNSRRVCRRRDGHLCTRLRRTQRCLGGGGRTSGGGRGGGGDDGGGGGELGRW
mgnify:CR=1 FL=1